MQTMVLKTRSGATVDAQAEVTRYTDSQRMMRAAPIAVAGIVTGAASIVVPGVHLISTWLLPIIGISVAYFVYKTTVVVGRVTATCPECRGTIEVAKAGTVDDDPLYVRCSGCNIPLECQV